MDIVSMLSHVYGSSTSQKRITGTINYFHPDPDLGNLTTVTGRIFKEKAEQDEIWPFRWYPLGYRKKAISLNLRR